MSYIVNGSWQRFQKSVFVFVVTLFLTWGCSTLSAAPSGFLTLGNCGGDGVIVTATTIDWLPAGGGNGCTVTGFGTSVAYTGPATLGAGVSGSLKDLTSG